MAVARAMICPRGGTTNWTPTVAMVTALATCSLSQPGRDAGEAGAPDESPVSAAAELVVQSPPRDVRKTVWFDLRPD
jgi:hypothetical protein